MPPSKDDDAGIEPDKHILPALSSVALTNDDRGAVMVSSLENGQIPDEFPLRASQTVTLRKTNVDAPKSDRTSSLTTNETGSITTTSHVGARETARTALATGNLRVPKFSKSSGENQKPDAVSLPTFAASDNPLTPYQSIRYRLPFGPAISPPNPNLSFKTQILENTRQWVFLASSIVDEKRRKDVLDRAFDKYEKIWFEALRIGYKSGGESSPRGEPDLQNSERRGNANKSRKRDIPPHAVHVFIPEKFKNNQGRPFPLTGITAGELQEAGITEAQVRKRAHDGEYSRAREIFHDVYDDLERSVEEGDWQGTATRTTLNPTGRDLFFYCLYVTQLYEQSRRQLEQYQARFKTHNQIRNGLRNIEKTEKERRIFLAMALELAELESTSDASKSTIAEGDDMQNSSTVLAHTRERLLRAVDLVLETHDFNHMRRAFEASEYSESLLDTDDTALTVATLDDQCKKALTDILSYTKERTLVLHETNCAQHEDEKQHWNEQLETCETNIRTTKKSLRRIAEVIRQTHIIEPDITKNAPMGQSAGTNLPTSAGAGLESGVPQSAVLNTGLKRPAEEEVQEDDPELRAKRRRQDIDVPGEYIGNGPVSVTEEQTTTEIEKTATQTLGTVSVQSMENQTLHPSSVTTGETIQPTAQETPFQQPLNKELTQKDYYIRDLLIPLANSLLTSNGHAPMPPSVVDYQSAKNALVASGLPVTERNKLGIEYNKGLYNDWNTKHEHEGMDGQEQQAKPRSRNELVLSERKDGDDGMDGTDGNSGSLPTGQPDPSRPALVVKLKVGSLSDCDPAQFSCNAVYQHKGFQYRYTPQSTFAERRAADEVLDMFVRDRMKQKGQYQRYGRYETICLPGDPQQKTIVHGKWDTKDGQPIEGAEWFYSPDAERSTATDQLNDAESDYHEEEDVRARAFDFERNEDEEDDWTLQTGPAKPSSTSSTKKANQVTFTPTSNSQQANRITSTPKQQKKKSTVNPKVKTAIRLRVNANNASAIAPRRQVKRSKVAKATAQTKDSKRGKSRGRPRRASSKRSYTEDEFPGDSEDEYVPGHSD
ncbi:hypothetical protein LTR84_010982 [Exophiala bonariae]|uniref:Uncharacterized protein n=1 Tax=Exophiala bonariae TaxID=1690606 RepID=A0AAV9NI40_9EURO|nr:hypothetical protein LTR84_010982 [Exophiala bonariae]